MKIELSRCQTGKIRVLNKASRLRSIIILDEVRQRPVPKTKRNSLSLDILLADARNNLHIFHRIYTNQKKTWSSKLNQTVFTTEPLLPTGSSGHYGFREFPLDNSWLPDFWSSGKMNKLFRHFKRCKFFDYCNYLTALCSSSVSFQNCFIWSSSCTVLPTYSK